MEQHTRPRWSVVVHLIFLGSGVAGLGYEIVWTKMFAIGLGHEMPSLLAVVAAFFGGLAIGAWTLDGRISRSAVPGRWYAALETIIGCWALIGLLLIPRMDRVAAPLIGLDPSPIRLWLVSFALPLVVLLPATVSMGATLPAMERLAARLRGRGGSVAGIYAVNTAGAVIGTLATTMLLMPMVGLRETIVTLAVINFACAAATLLGPAAGERERGAVEHDFDEPPGRTRLTVTLAATGMLGIGYEVLGVRVMAQVLENTVYSFASALAIYLTGTAIGAALYQRYARKREFTRPLLLMLQLLAVSCLLGIAVMQGSKGIYEGLRLWLGAGATGSMVAELALAAIVFGAPTILMGATFSHLAQASRGAQGGVGRALAINTLGGAAAPPLFGVMLLPLIGVLWSLLAVVAGYVLLIPFRAATPQRLLPLATAVLVLPFLGNLVLVETGGDTIVDYRDGVTAAVAVVEGQATGRRLKVNDRFSMGSTLGAFSQRRQAHIPLLLHPAPRRALFLGLGTGITAGTATLHPDLEVTGVELMPEVVELLPAFAPLNRLEQLRGDHAIVVADARRFVRATDEHYDVIVSELFHPGRDGAGTLYTVEHFEAIRGRLAEGGLFCQWLSLYQLDMPTLAMIVRTFLEVFPDATAWFGHFNADTPVIALVGREAPLRLTPGWYERRVQDPALRQSLLESGLSNELTVAGTMFADRDELAALAGAGPLNTDVHPRVMFQAPLYAYRKDEPPRDRVELLLGMREPDAAAILAADASAEAIERHQAYLEARDLYLQSDILWRRGLKPLAIDYMLQSIRRSADFRTAHHQLLDVALHLPAEDRTTARRILEVLVEVNPDDPRAASALRRLGR